MRYGGMNMVKKDLLNYLEFADANLRRQMRLAEARRTELDDEAADDLNGTTAAEDAFSRGAEHAFCRKKALIGDDDTNEEDYEGDY
jgi:hypothetical protein